VESRSRSRSRFALALIAAYVACVLLANWAAAQGAWVLVPGVLVVPYGVPFIAPTFTLRDAIHRAAGVRAASAAVWLGVAASLAQAASDLLGGGSLAEPGGVARIALAGVLAFAVSENADTLVYQLLRRDSWVARALKSNAVSTLLDSLVFIGLAFGLLPALILGQWLSKMLIAGLVIAVLKGPATRNAYEEQPV
jgi:uncharacterized PurR-regulated membrane protein YhhQ (DUF165 family)